MTRHRACLTITLLVTAATGFGVTASATDTDSCCVANVRFSGVCQISTGPGESCGAALAYLNDLASAGRAYCGSTDIRRGWRRVDCGSGGPGVTGQAVPYTGAARDVVGPAPPSSAQPIFLTPTAPQEAPSAAQASVIQVRLDQPVDTTGFAPGDEFTAQLTAPLSDADGVVLAPRGSLVFGTVASGDDRARLILTDVLVDDELLALDDGGGAPPVATGTLAAGAEITAPVAGIGALSPELTALRRAIQAWRDAFVAGDVDGVARWFSDHAVLSPPAAPPVAGRETIAEYWRRRLADRRGRVEFENLDAGVEGDLGFAAARYRLLTDAGEELSGGHVLEVWRHHGDDWRIERASWTVEPPAE